MLDDTCDWGAEMSITVQGIEETFQVLGRVAAFNKLEEPMRQSLYLGQGFMAQYPPAPARSKYIRGRGKSEHLGQRWTTNIDRSSDGLIGRLGNNASYGPWVQSERFQTRWHRRTGWRTDQQFIRENEAKVVGFFQTAVDAAIRG
jgi:hypothetical protein